MSRFEPLPTDAEEYREALNRGNAFFVRGEFDEALGNLDLETAERLDRPGE